MRRQGLWAVYGTVVIPRGYCSECDTYAFIIDQQFACCGNPAETDTERFVRMSDVAAARSGPSKRWRKYILELQQFRCFYCDRRFGSRVYRGLRMVSLCVHWDHVNPYVYSLDNRDQNFVAACHICNGIKSSLIFGSVEDARTHIRSRWEAKGYSDVPRVRNPVHSETTKAKILQSEVSQPRLENQRGRTHAGDHRSLGEQLSLW